MRCRCSLVWLDTQNDSVLSILIIYSDRRWNRSWWKSLGGVDPLSSCPLKPGLPEKWLKRCSPACLVFSKPSRIFVSRCPLTYCKIQKGVWRGNPYKRDHSPMTCLHLSEQKPPNRTSVQPWVFFSPGFPFNSFFFFPAHHNPLWWQEVSPHLNTFLDPLKEKNRKGERIFAGSP